jgi:hypothetical protein
VSEAHTVKGAKARWPVCGRPDCHHPAPLHSSNGEPGPCLAQGCHGGPDSQPCPGFISKEEWDMKKDLSDAIDEAQAQAQTEDLPSGIQVGMVEELKTNEDLRERMRAEGIDPDVVYAQARKRASQLRDRVEAEMTAERQTMLYRAAAGAAVLLAAVLVIRGIRAVRRRAQG